MPVLTIRTCHVSLSLDGAQGIPPLKRKNHIGKAPAGSSPSKPRERMGEEWDGEAVTAFLAV